MLLNCFALSRPGLCKHFINPMGVMAIGDVRPASVICCVEREPLRPILFHKLELVVTRHKHRQDAIVQVLPAGPILIKQALLVIR